MKTLSFTKMQGLGNDFVVIDATKIPANLTERDIRKLADRHFGVGCDQVLLVETPDDDEVDFRYRIFNADGSEVSQCGNGARCFARFVFEKRLTQKRDIRVETRAGKMLLTLANDNDVIVNMGEPNFEPNTIPISTNQKQKIYQLLTPVGAVEFGAVSMGNPHAVIRVDSVLEAPVDRVGPYLEKHAFFPERANIGFLEIQTAHTAKLRVFERGSGETLACGSGACAAVVVGIEQGWLESPVVISLPGGSLKISWAGQGHSVVMEGPAVTVFEGVISL